MKFSVQRKVLIQMLKMLTGGHIKKDAKLRMAAQDGRVTLTCEDLTEASYEAQVEEEGVCFFRHKFLPRMLKSYTDQEVLTIEVDPDGIKIGNTQISRGMWESSLFMNPDFAPQRLILKTPEKKKVPEEEDPAQMTFQI